MNPYKISAKTAKGRAAMKKVGKKVGPLAGDITEERESDKADSVEMNEADDVKPLKKSTKEE